MVTDEHSHLIDAARRQVEDARAVAARSRPIAAESCTDRVGSFGAIPGYRIERVVHRGGQGTVYQAVQVSTSRRVALKVMRDRPFPSPVDRARFEREVQILGQLDHPSIVRIIDSGEANGRDYLAMDFVDGVPLDEYGWAGAPRPESRRSVGAGDPTKAACPSGPSPRPPVKDTLRLFAEVCDAVHAAHLRGVIHRDLKPGNILVDSTGRPRVLDFGLAKRFAVDEGDSSSVATMTETGQFLGSLPWASPEQVAAAEVGSGSGAGSGAGAGAGAGGGGGSCIDLRSDVYSLGVLLYQLLTGEFPYRVSGAVRDISENILSADPVPPGTKGRHVDDEVETIVLKALSKEPLRRYQSAGDLACDIRRYLAGELIEAKRDSLAYVIRKQIRRHRMPAAVAAAFLLVVLAGGIVSASLWRSAVVERDLQESQRARAESISAVLHDILASASPEESGGLEVSVQDVLDAAASQLDAGSLRSAPEVDASVRRTLGESYLALGRLEAAQRQLDAALALHQRACGRRHAETARTLAALGRLSLAQGEDREAVHRLEEALAILEAVPQGARDDVPSVMMLLASALARMERTEEVQALHGRALARVVVRFGEGHPETDRIRLAIETHRLGREGTVELLLEKLRLSRDILGPRHPETLRTLTRLAGELHVTGRVDDSERMYLEALSLGREIHGDHHQDVLLIVTNLNWLYEHTGQREKARANLRQWEPVARSTFGPRSVRYASYLTTLGSIVVRSGEPVEGEAILQQALELLMAIGRDQSWQGAECRIRLARAMIDRGDEAGAERLARDVLAIEAEASERMALRRAQAQALLGEVLARRGEYDDAEALLLAAHDALAPRRSMPELREIAVRGLVGLYEAWNAATPGAGKGELAERWRAELVRPPPRE